VELIGGGQRIVVVVGAGGVGKTTLAASLALGSARRGSDTLVMTFDPSLRLKDALGVGGAARGREIRVPVETPGSLRASLLDAKRTFDRLVQRHAPDEKAAERILGNRFYAHLAGGLSGILEYMAVERLYEVAMEGRHERIVLDTPPTRQALDFLGAPDRIVSFLDSGAIQLALRPWFDERGQLRVASRLGPLGRRLEAFLDRVVGMGLLRDMAEFFQAFAPLYGGFKQRALAVGELLRSEQTGFVLVATPGAEAIPDAMFFARRLCESGHRLERVVVNRLHPPVPKPASTVAVEAAFPDPRHLFHWLAERDRRGIRQIRSLLPDGLLAAIPLRPEPPADLDALEQLAATAIDIAKYTK